MPEDLLAHLVAQAHGGVPIAAIRRHGRANRHGNRRAARIPGAVAQHRAHAAQGDRHDRDCGLRGAEEGAGAERHQAGVPHQRALREHDQRYAAPGRLRELVGVLGALLHVEALDELRAQPHDEGARDKALAQLALGDEGVVAPGQDGEQHRAIEVAGVVRRNHHGAGRRQIFPAAHRQRDAAKPEKKPRAALRDLPGPPAGRNRGRGQDHDEQRAEKQPRVGGEQQPARDAPAAAQLRQHAADREAHELPPDGLRFHRRGPALVIVARGEAADLAARSLRHRVRRREHDVVDRRADQADGKLVDPAPDLGVARRVDLARLGEHYDAFGPARRVHAAEHRHAAAPDAGDAADRFLELVGADVASAADDDVLFTAGDVEVAFGQVGAISGVHPFAVEQSLRRLGIAVVAAGRRRAAELQLTFAAVGKLQTGGVDHPQIVVGNRGSAAHQLERRGVVRPRRHRFPGARQPVAIDQVDLPRLPRRREGEPDRGFCKAVDRRNHVFSEVPSGEPFLERGERIGAHRLGAVEREAPRREIEPLQLLVRNAPQAQLVGEVGAARNGAAVAMDGAQPLARPRQEGER